MSEVTEYFSYAFSSSPSRSYATDYGIWTYVIQDHFERCPSVIQCVITKIPNVITIL
jgi:hypothetical protein